RTINDCPDGDVWRVAIFDVVCANTDRNDTNWGFVQDMTQPKLIDHGLAFDANQASTSPFAAARRGQAIPDEHVPRLERLIGRHRETPLRDVLEAPAVDAVVSRARS